ncbi:type III secretion system stalk subunit SctO [Pseudomonas borbori]
MSRHELAALRPIRQHREAQAERAWREEHGRLQALLERERQAEAQLECARLQQREQRAALSRAHQGQTLTPMLLAAWGEQEKRLLAELGKQAQALDALRQERLQQDQQAVQARQQLRGRQRQLEKLRELSRLLKEAPEHEPC